MRLFALIAITMVAFAANSVLNRAGIVSFGLDPLGFAGVRLAGGAVMLAVLVGLRGPIPAVSRGNVMGAGL
ncbi:MAG: EamA family transporter, partial [Octadecabacter sp.]